MKENEEKNTGDVTDEMLDQMFGGLRRKEVGECFQIEDFNGMHYYMQQKNCVMHVYGIQLINNLHNSCLANKLLVPITKEKFEEALRMAIFNIGIADYVNTK